MIPMRVTIFSTRVVLDAVILFMCTVYFANSRMNSTMVTGLTDKVWVEQPQSLGCDTLDRHNQSDSYY